MCQCLSTCLSHGVIEDTCYRRQTCCALDTGEGLEDLEERVHRLFGVETPLVLSIILFSGMQKSMNTEEITKQEKRCPCSSVIKWRGINEPCSPKNAYCLVSILSKANLVYTLQTYFLELILNIIVPFTFTSSKLSFSFICSYRAFVGL